MVSGKRLGMPIALRAAVDISRVSASMSARALAPTAIAASTLCRMWRDGALSVGAASPSLLGLRGLTPTAKRFLRSCARRRSTASSSTRSRARALAGLWLRSASSSASLSTRDLGAANFTA